MKKYILLLLTVVAISCNTKKENDTVKDTTAVHEEHNEKELHLTQAQVATAKIKVAAITKRTIREKVSVTGTIEVPPQSKATIYAPMEAFVYKTELLPGDKVKKGQIIATLKHPSFVELQHAYIKAVNDRNVAKADFERKKVLLENDITSKKSFETVKGKYQSIQSLVNNYSTQLRLAGLHPEEILNKGIQSYIYVRTPIEGYVVENNLNQGKYLAANTEMMEIIDNDHMHAELNVFATDILKIKKGDDFVFQPSGVDLSYRGYIKLISQKVNDVTKTVNVHGHFEDEKHILKSGMFINAQVLIGGKKVYAVPENAIVEIEGETFVFVKESTTDFLPLEVSIGNTDNGFTEIKSIEGNVYDLEIVTEGAHFLKGKLLQMAGNMEGHAH